ncbi:Asp23/Gls24 family envelope stress response protein [Rhodococcus globerulus]|uniref:Asp23/Gls24 family envelope stress response protein n=1 Tax=Rhodococcus globerulus TaxID=33008 RepID=A0ABU4C5A0_RHOGO|nr:Asp23/Gls24 family envelope stress response protein [Rhodococcus globerulus]MDV6271533.1 Asp23/Gls24 family envelope stress response protein [Rhodococcus globerulus]
MPEGGRRGEPPAGEQADRIASAVTAVPGVVGLHAGSFGEVGTYLPGRRVPGIRIGEEATEVHVSVGCDVPVRETAALIRRTVAAITEGPVHITIEDVVPPLPHPPEG